MAHDALNAKDMALRVVISRALTMEVREGCGVDAKSSSSRQKRFTELLVLSSLYTETVLPMNWEGGAMGL